MSDYTNKGGDFGEPEGIENRLAMWGNQLSNDSRCPIHYRGMIADLKCASRMLGGDPNKKYPDIRKKEPAPPKSAPALQPSVEYDL